MRRFTLLVLIASCLASCYSPRYVYGPSTQNIPLLQEKNDFEVSANYGGSLNVFQSYHNYNRGLDLHGAYALSDHFALMVNKNFRWERNGNPGTHPKDSSNLFYKRNFTEIAAGYYTGLGRKTGTQFQVFAGAAFGKSKLSDQSILNGILLNKFFNDNVTKLFIQPALIGNISDNFAIAFSTRFTNVSFSNIQTDYTSEEVNKFQLDSLSHFNMLFWEPAINITFGFPDVPVKFRYQMGFAILTGGHFYWHRNTNVGIGIVYDFRSSKK